MNQTMNYLNKYFCVQRVASLKVFIDLIQLATLFTLNKFMKKNEVV